MSWWRWPGGWIEASEQRRSRIRSEGTGSARSIPPSSAEGAGLDDLLDALLRPDHEQRRAKRIREPVRL